MTTFERERLWSSALDALVAVHAVEWTASHPFLLDGDPANADITNQTVNIGTVVTRSVRLVTVPAPLIEIHPAWRGFLYFVYDDRIVIVEPGTLRIVTVIEV